MAKARLSTVALKVVLKTTTKTYADYRFLNIEMTKRENITKKPITLHVQVLKKDLRRSVSAESM